MRARGLQTRAQCGGCGHPRKEHRDRDLCTVPRCPCAGYFLMELTKKSSSSSRKS